MNIWIYVMSNEWKIYIIFYCFEIRPLFLSPWKLKSFFEKSACYSCPSGAGKGWNSQLRYCNNWTFSRECRNVPASVTQRSGMNWYWHRTYGPMRKILHIFPSKYHQKSKTLMKLIIFWFLLFGNPFRLSIHMDNHALIAPMMMININ